MQHATQVVERTKFCECPECGGQYAIRRTVYKIRYVNGKEPVQGRQLERYLYCADCGAEHN